MGTPVFYFQRENLPVFLGWDFLSRTGELLKPLSPSGKAAVVTDPRVNKLYGEKLKNSLKNAGFASHFLEIPRGEGYKNLEQVKTLYRLFLEYQLDRSTPVLALGGGVITDLTGFAASTFMRGLPLFLLPTTLLAQVDAGLGGKTGINLPEGKNLAGTFYFPQAVIIDPQTLSTLEEKEFSAGIAEVIKAGFLAEPSLLELIREKRDDLKARKPEALLPMIERSAKIKLEIVEKDPLETGEERLKLNFGHTLAHALEAAGQYKLYSHGEAVGLGMLFAAYLSETLLGFSPEHTGRLKDLLGSFSLPTRLDTLTDEDILQPLTRDKKKRGRLRLVLLSRPGAPQTVELPPPPLIKQALEALRRE